MGFGNRETGRSDKRDRRRNGYALTPKKGADGSTVITRAIVGDERKLKTGDRIIKGGRPSRSRHATGTIGTGESAGTVIEVGAIPGIAAGVIGGGSRWITGWNIDDR